MHVKPADPEQLFAQEPGAYEAYRVVRTLLEALGPFEVRTSGTQVAFRRRRGFAFLWVPVAWARRPGVLVVLSIALGEHVDSGRWKEVVHPASTTWMQHLEGGAPTDLDAEVGGWLRRAYADAG
jgi:Domain of unknown function (DUF5655)